jgi:hypothetical protein
LKQVVLLSKQDKGDATFSIEKRLLGWDINTSMMTITLPPHHVQNLTDLLQEMLSSTSFWASFAAQHWHCTGHHTSSLYYNMP